MKLSAVQKNGIVKRVRDCRYQTLAEALYAAVQLAEAALAVAQPAGEPVARHVDDTGFDGWLSCHEPDRTEGRRPAYTKRDLQAAYMAGYREGK